MYVWNWFIKAINKLYCFLRDILWFINHLERKHMYVWNWFIKAINKLYCFLRDILWFINHLERKRMYVWNWFIKAINKLYCFLKDILWFTNHLERKRMYVWNWFIKAINKLCFSISYTIKVLILKLLLTWKSWWEHYSFKFIAICRDNYRCVDYPFYYTHLCNFLCKKIRSHTIYIM